MADTTQPPTALTRDQIHALPHGQHVTITIPATLDRHHGVTTFRVEASTSDWGRYRISGQIVDYVGVTVATDDSPPVRHPRQRYVYWISYTVQCAPGAAVSPGSGEVRLPHPITTAEVVRAIERGLAQEIQDDLFTPAQIQYLRETPGSVRVHHFTFLCVEAGRSR